MNEKLVWLKKLIDEFCEEFLVYSDPTYTYEAQAPIYQFWKWVQSSCQSTEEMSVARAPKEGAKNGEYER